MSAVHVERFAVCQIGECQERLDIMSIAVVDVK